ncbi:MAG: hypothetical protein HY000_08755 [Planctomycetes bacterium]|nr:hypothetical protein [Planctomycetota bacterium]
MLGWSAVQAQTPPLTNTLLIEAEDFKSATGSTWNPIPVGENYYWATLANTFISRQKLLSAPEQCVRSEATIVADIPADGTYRVWTRYELPSRWRVEHTLKIEQTGKVALDRKYGKIDSPKLWPFSQGITPMVDWSWGSGDNVVWEFSDPVTISKGQAKFTLIAEQQAGESLPDCRGAARRNIDCVFLTTDLEDGIRDAKQAFYHKFDKHLNQRGDLWIRITNPVDGKAPLWVALDVKEHNPYWQKRNPAPRIGTQGEIAANPADADWLNPGQASPWVAVGQALDTTNVQELIVTANYKPAAGQAGPAGLNLTIQFARDNGGKQLIRQVTAKHDELNRVVFEVPADLRTTPEIKTLEEMHRDLLAFLRGLPQHGRVPQHVPVFGIMGGNWHGKTVKTPDEFYRLRSETGLLLGRNTWKSGDVPDDLAKQYSVTPRKNLEIDVRGVETPKLEEHLRKGVFIQVLIVSMGDEIGVGGYKPDNAQDQQQFRDYLTKLRGMDPADRVRQYAIHSDMPDPAAAKLTSDAKDGKNFYWSQLFSIDRGIDQLKDRTEIVEKVLGKGVYTGANYSPHPQYWPHVGQWWRLFRRHGMTMPWTEDWIHQVAELSPQVMGYLADVFRCAAKYEDMPIQIYTMPHSPGQTPRDLTLSFYSTLAHGNKMLNFFAAVPIYDYTENYVSWEARDNWKAVRDLTHEVGMADDIIWAGKVRPAPVAILLSHATDMYEQATGRSLYNLERKNIYFALRHAGIGVDFVTEEDVVEDWLDGSNGKGKAHRVLYVCGDHMLRACAEKIRDWVKGGGHLFSVAGGGFLDEYDQPLDVLLPVYGITEQKCARTTDDKNLWVKEGLAWVRPSDELKFQLRLTAELGLPHIPSLFTRQTFVPAKKESVWAVYSTGEPAAISSDSFGRGTAWIVGTFPGSAYVQPAIPKRPYDRGSSDANFNHFLPTAFSHDAQAVITSPLETTGIFQERPVETSEPLVDATVIEAPQGLAVPLANYSGKPVPALTVLVRNVGEFKQIFAVKHGDLKFERRGQDITFTLPLQWSEMLVIRR